MPKIPQYTPSSISTGRLKALPALQVPSAESVSEDAVSATALGRLAGTVSDTAVRIREKELDARELIKKQDEMEYVLQAESDFTEKWLNFLNEETQKRGKGTYGNVERARKWIDENTKQYYENAPGRGAQLALKRRFNSITQTQLYNLAKIQARERKQVHKTAIENLFQTKKKEAYLDPDSAIKKSAEVASSYNTMLSLGMITQEEAESSIKRATGEIFGAALDGLLDRDPERAIKEFESGKYNEFLTQNQLNYYADRIREKKNQLEREKRIRQRELEIQKKERLRELKDLMEDEKRSVLDTGMRLKGIDLRAELQKIDPDLASKYEKQIKQLEQIHGILQESRLLPLNKRLQLIEKYEPSGGEKDYKNKKALYDDLYDIVMKDWKRFRDDPVNYLSPEINKTVSLMIEQGRLNPDDQAGIVRARISQAINLQRQMGIPELNIKALSNEQAKQIAAELNSLEGDKRAAAMDEISKLYTPRYLPIVMRQLEDEGLRMENMFLSLENLNPETRATLAYALEAGEKELSKAIGDKEKDIDGGLDQALEPFFETVSAGGLSARRLIRMNQIRKAVKLTAMAYAAKGMEGDEALSRAVHDMLDGRYHYQDGYRVPIQYDAGKVERYANHMREGIKEQDLVLPAGDRRLSEDYRRNAFISSIMRDAYWATNEDESGLVLMHRFLNTPMPVLVRDEHGRIRRYEFTFDDAMNYRDEKEHESMWQEFSLLTGGGMIDAFDNP